MEHVLTEEEINNKRKGKIVSGIAHTILLIMFFLPLLTYQDPPPGQEGVLISFGEPNTGSSSERAPLAVAEPEEAEEPEEEVETPPVEEVEEVIEPPKEVKKEAPKKNDRQLEIDKNSKERAIKKAKEDAKKKADADAKKAKDKIAKEEREAKEKAKKVAAEAARKKAAAEAKRKADYEAAKNKFGNAFGNGEGEGEGDNGKEGNDGRLDGDPDGKALDGVSSGSGVLGGGLKGRGIKSRPKITDNSNKTGKVVVKVCVDANGNVTSARSQLKNSTTSDSGLKAKAVAGAKKYKFDSGTDGQCGTITITFKVK